MSKYYNDKGVLDSTLDNDTCFCKSNDDETQFFIRRVNVGINAGHYLNPSDMVGKSSFTQVSKNREFTTFHKADEESFRQYLKFLETGNIGRLHIAEREK